MKKLTIVLLTLMIVSCAKEGTYVPSQNAKADFNVEFLFECDDVKIYRFCDAGEFKYFATGNGRMTNSTYTRSNGKYTKVVDDTVIQ